MSPEWQAILYGLAVFLFLVHAVKPQPKVNLLALGLATGFFVAFYNAVDLATKT